MGGKKKLKEPEVTIPEGDAKIGKGIFEDQCSVCHAIDVCEC
jgi:mono/diheme cytochrome c family protein